MYWTLELASYLSDAYEIIQEIWPDYPTDEDFLWNEDEY